MTNIKDMKISSVEEALANLIQVISNPIWQEPSLAALRATIISGTITTVSTVTNCTSLNQLAGLDVKQTSMYDLSLIAWALNVGNVV